MSYVRRVVGLVSTKLLWQAAATAALIIVSGVLDAQTELVDVLRDALPDWVEAPVIGIVLTVLPALVAWLKAETNPAPSAVDAALSRYGVAAVPDSNG